MAQLPLKTKSPGSQIETRPMYIEEWLDSLPYIDFHKTASLIEQALAATNKADIKPSVRLELNSLYHRPYQYYLESQIKTGAQHTMQTIDAMQGQIGVMKQIALHLAYSCKLAFDTLQTKKSIWRPGKPPYPALLMSMQYLSQALIFSYLEYSPVPRNVWRQLNFIYDLAESSQVNKQVFSVAGAGEQANKTSFEHAYKRILMASLVDPHHLPFGAIWEIYEQLDDWVNMVELLDVRPVKEANGHFILDLRSDKKPIPYKKFNLDKTTKTTRLLDAGQLVEHVARQNELLRLGQPLNNSIKLSPFYAKPLLLHMHSAWNLPSNRAAQRQNTRGQLQIYTGIDAVYYLINDGHAFLPPVADDANTDEIDITDTEHTRSHTDGHKQTFAGEQWRIVDESSGGYALIRDDKPGSATRVGQLVGLHTDDSDDNYQLGLIRWLMISRQVHKVGIEKLSNQVTAISIRARQGSEADRDYRPGFLLRDGEGRDKFSIVAAKGLYIHLRELDILVNGKEQRITAGDLLETGVACEIFNYSVD